MAKQRGEEWKEYDAAVKWMLTTFFICLGLTLFFFVFALPLSYLVGNGVSKATFSYIGKFLNLIASDPSHLFRMYSRWFHQVAVYRGAFPGRFGFLFCRLLLFRSA